MNKLQGLVVLFLIVIGLWVPALSAAECDKPGWDTQGWGFPTHYYAVGAVNVPGKYISLNAQALFVMYYASHLELRNPPPFACGLTEDALGNPYVVRLGTAYPAFLSKEPQLPATSRDAVPSSIKFTSYGGGLLEGDVVYFPSKGKPRDAGEAALNLPSSAPSTRLVSTISKPR